MLEAARTTGELLPGVDPATEEHLLLALTNGLTSAVLGTRLPGPGAIYISQTLNFRAPVRIGDTVEVRVEVVELVAERHRARLACTCTVAGEVVLDGEATVKVPTRADSPPLL